MKGSVGGEPLVMPEYFATPHQRVLASCQEKEERLASMDQEDRPQVSIPVPFELAEIVEFWNGTDKELAAGWVAVLIGICRPGGTFGITDQLRMSACQCQLDKQISKSILLEQWKMSSLGPLPPIFGIHATPARFSINQPSQIPGSKSTMDAITLR